MPSYVPASQADSYLASSTNTDDAYGSSAQADNAPGSIDNGFFTGLANSPFLQAFPSFNPNSITGGGAGKIGAGIDETTKGLGDLLSIVTDLPRVATILVGGVLLAAGIFAIAGGSHKDVIELVKGK